MPFLSFFKAFLCVFKAILTSLKYAFQAKLTFMSYQHILGTFYEFKMFNLTYIYVSEEFEDSHYIFEWENGNYIAKKHFNFERPYLLIRWELRKNKKVFDLACTSNPLKMLSFGSDCSYDDLSQNLTFLVEFFRILTFSMETDLENLYISVFQHQHRINK